VYAYKASMSSGIFSCERPRSLTLARGAAPAKEQSGSRRHDRSAEGIGIRSIGLFGILFMNNRKSANRRLDNAQRLFFSSLEA
jgi:hypothetical protein